MQKHCVLFLFSGLYLRLLQFYYTFHSFCRRYFSYFLVNAGDSVSLRVNRYSCYRKHFLIDLIIFLLSCVFSNFSFNFSCYCVCYMFKCEYIIVAFYYLFTKEQGKGFPVNKTTNYCLNNVHIIFITTYTRHDVNLVLNHCIILGICTLHNVYTYIVIHARPERLYD